MRTISILLKTLLKFQVRADTSEIRLSAKGCMATTSSELNASASLEPSPSPPPDFVTEMVASHRERLRRKRDRDGLILGSPAGPAISSAVPIADLLLGVDTLLQRFGAVAQTLKFSDTDTELSCVTFLADAPEAAYQQAIERRRASLDSVLQSLEDQATALQRGIQSHKAACVKREIRDGLRAEILERETIIRKMQASLSTAKSLAAPTS